MRGNLVLLTLSRCGWQLIASGKQGSLTLVGPVIIDIGMSERRDFSRRCTYTESLLKFVTLTGTVV